MTERQVQIITWSIVLVVGISIGWYFGTKSPQTIATVETAAKVLGGRSFTWQDDTGVKYGIPTEIHVLSFSKDFTKCRVQSRSITKDKFEMDETGNVTAKAERYIDNGAQYVGFHCSVDGYDYTTDRSDKIKVYSSGSRVPFSEATRN